MFWWLGKSMASSLLMGKKLNYKNKPSYEVSIFMGSIDNDSKLEIADDDLCHEISVMQEIEKSKYSVAGWVPVRMSQMTLLCGTSYKEKGWEISAINYPRTATGKNKIESFMKTLAKHLLKKFNQHRITLVLPKNTIMYENES